MSEVARVKTVVELWDFLDKEKIIRYMGGYWEITSKLDELTENCDCVACSARRALKTVGITHKASSPKVKNGG